MTHIRQRESYSLIDQWFLTQLSILPKSEDPLELKMFPSYLLIYACEVSVPKNQHNSQTRILVNVRFPPFLNPLLKVELTILISSLLIVSKEDLVQVDCQHGLLRTSHTKGEPLITVP